MNHFLSSTFIIFFSLFTFISNSMAQQTSSANTDEVNGCTNYIIDVYPEYDELPSGQSFDIDLHSYYDPNGSEVIANRIKLELLFSLRRHSTQEPIQIVGVGESANFNGYFATPPPLFGRTGPFRFFPIFPIGGQSVLDVARAAIRDGYEALGEYLSEQRRLGKVERQIRPDTVLISLGQLHGVQEGDVFRIYSEGEGSDSCNIVKDTESYLATGTVVDTSDNISMLQINADGVGRVQGGDIVEFDPSIDLVSRGQADHSQVNVLQMGRIPPQIFVHFVSNRYKEPNYLRNRRRTITRDITFYIEYDLVKEAPKFGLQVIQ